MENGTIYPVQLQLRDGSWELIEDVILVRHGASLRLEGELNELLRFSGMWGNTCYLPHNMVYAIPLRYRFYGKHMARFFWVFADYREPWTGMMRPISWFEAQKSPARLSIADYLVVKLDEYCEKLLKTSPPPDEMGEGEELAWLYGMYADLMKDFPHLTIHEQELYLDETYGFDTLVGYRMVVEQDESSFVITPEGYLTTPPNHYVLPHHKDGTLMFRLVKPAMPSLKALAVIQ